MEHDACRGYARGSTRLYPQVEEDRDGVPTPDEGSGQVDGAAGRGGELSTAQGASSLEKEKMRRVRRAALRRAAHDGERGEDT